VRERDALIITECDREQGAGAHNDPFSSVIPPLLVTARGGQGLEVSALSDQ